MTEDNGTKPRGLHSKLAEIMAEVGRVPKRQCLAWHNTKTRGGYGVIRILGVAHYVHRVAYEMVKGPIPNGMTIDHLCRNRACFNPDHMEPVTRGENCRRGARAKINAATAEQIRKSPLHPVALAAKHGIARSTVYNILAGRRWAK